MSLLCPSRVDPTRDDAIELLHYFFDFISKPERKEKFEFWFELWKENYYTSFYPQVSLDMALIPNITGSLFLSIAPEQSLSFNLPPPPKKKLNRPQILFPMPP